MGAPSIIPLHSEKPSYHMFLLSQPLCDKRILFSLICQGHVGNEKLHFNLNSFLGILWPQKKVSNRNLEVDFIRLINTTEVTRSSQVREWRLRELTTLRFLKDKRMVIKLLCIRVVLSWDELKVRENLLDGDYEIYMVRPIVVTVLINNSFVFNTQPFNLPPATSYTWQ